METNTVYIGLGSNIEQPRLQIKNAITALAELPGTMVINDSGYFKSKPMGPEDQPDYVNAVVEIETTMSAIDLLEHCQKIEQQQGRIKRRRWGERSIDLDILLYADELIETDVLAVPHPGICQRDFVYMPLLKLDPEINVPGTGLLRNIIKDKEQPAVERYKADHQCQFAGNIE